ncbi:hypothetical protein [Paenibacillus sacheonensis]|uniref:Signal peptide protein n=1 Tax=Paenibacillus sacheonensis TaxID=742054 RepID=A0A7X4YTV9_9BACL|nr:hypothetical protein [Paenibacillus sacheonensis]MBM7568604.1 hypothetical protein [Paenibacillus sacheonensis]NBC72500.1 signal peptide protein [Paenibacillus sacheonensis]
MKRIYLILGGLMLCLLLSACGTEDQTSIFSTSSTTDDASSSVDVARVPWDYRIMQGKVGDLVGSDMTILPDNVMLPNDNNFATGDAVWTLQYMDAEITTDEQKRNQLQLSAWGTLKSYKDEASAKKDIAELKETIQTELDLVGVYKTENQGKFREFAVVAMPSGNVIKQPISEEKYASLKDQKKVKANIEQIHDFGDYDTVYAKFRGWAQ